MRQMNRAGVLRLFAAAEAYAVASARCQRGTLPPPHYTLELEAAAVAYQRSRDQSAERLGRARAPAVAPGGVL
jgi:hypothetical protein